MKRETVLVTGGAGYIGSNLVPKLLEDDYKVIVYDLYIYGKSLKPHPNLIEVKGDIRNKRLLEKVVSKVDKIVHLACIANDPIQELKPELSESIDVGGTKILLELAKKHKVKQFVYASSSSVYGVRPEKNVTEESKCTPLTKYSKSKLVNERQIFDNDWEFATTSLRPATVCGWSPRVRLDVAVNALAINALVNKNIKVFDGEQFRSHLNIYDMVDAYKCVLESPLEKIDRKIYNVHGENVKLIDVAKRVKKLIGGEITIVPVTDNRSYRLNSDKIKKELGFKPKYTIEDAIESLQIAYNDGKIVDGLENPIYYNIKMMKELNLK